MPDTCARWLLISDGYYSFTNGPCHAALSKIGKRWALSIEGGAPIDLGRKASFTSAENKIGDYLTNR